MLDRREFILRSTAAAAAGSVWAGASASLAAAPSVAIDRAWVANRVLVAHWGKNVLRATVLSPHIVRLDLLYRGHHDPATPLLDPHAHFPGDAQAQVHVGAEKLQIKTAALALDLARATAGLTLCDATGRYLLRPHHGPSLYVHPRQTGLTGFAFQCNPETRFYGISCIAMPGWGGKKYSMGTSMLRNGTGMPDGTYQVDAGVEGGGGAPFIWTTDGYGLLVDSDGGFFMMGPNRVAFNYGNESLDDYGCRYHRPNSLSLFILVGSPRDIFRSVAEITGFMPMFPRWAYGFTNSQWGTDQHLLRHYLTTYRAKDIPIDNFTLDFDWKDWGANHYGEFRWNPVKYSQALLPPENPESLLSWTSKLDCKITGIMKPRIILSTRKGHLQPLTTQGAESRRLGIWFPGEKPFKDYFSHLYSIDVNFYMEKCRRWYWNATWSHGCMQRGIAGFWNDEADYGQLGNFEFLHMQQALYEGQRRDRPDRRVWSLNRNFYLGSQRYGYATWSGDIPTGFGSMALQTLRMLTMINLGQMRWGMDSGGFEGHPSDQNYARWIQFSALCPIFRVHCTLGQRRQPWVYGTQACETAKQAMRLRYALFPYTYAVDHAACTQTGIGLVRPLLFDYPHDFQVADLSNQWMFGDYLLAAPVLSPLEQSSTRRVYLPGGNIWIDYFRGTRYRGGQWLDYPLNTDSWMDIPLFIKDGAIIPTFDPVPALHTARPTVAYLDIFPSRQVTQGIFYEDDGDTFDYERNGCHRQVIAVQQNLSDLQTNLTIEAKTGGYSSSVQYFILRVHGQAAVKVHALGVDALPRIADDLGLTQHQAAWYVDEDVYGPVTVIKLPAGAAKDIQIAVTGNQSMPKIVERLLATQASLSGPVATDTPLQSNNGMYMLANEFGRFGDLRNNIQTNHTGYTGSGFIAGFNHVDTAATYYFSRRTAGLYRVQFRFANGNAGRTQTLNVYVNGIRYGAVDIPGLANWDQWQSVAMYIPLAAGANTLMLRRDQENSGQVNLDTIEVAMQPAK